jgi:hypothetical protein
MGQPCSFLSILLEAAATEQILASAEILCYNSPTKMGA